MKLRKQINEKTGKKIARGAKELRKLIKAEKKVEKIAKGRREREKIKQKLNVGRKDF